MNTVEVQTSAFEGYSDRICKDDSMLYKRHQKQLFVILRYAIMVKLIIREMFRISHVELLTLPNI